MTKSIDLLFGATIDFLPFAVVTAVSAAGNLNNNYKLRVHFLYADIKNNISKEESENIFEMAQLSLLKNDICIYYYNVTKEIQLFKGQNIGMWGEEISYTHYMYLLAPIILDKSIDKVIYIDTDMIVNTDLSLVWNCDMQKNLIAMGAPRGQEEMGEDVSNSGFVILNLFSWREEDVLSKILEFGRHLPRARFCDQWLLYQYFTKLNSDRLLLLDKKYNIFPQLFKEIPLAEIKILHFTGWNNIKPWVDLNSTQRGSFIWWEYARRTFFYEYFIFKLLKTKYISCQPINTTKSLNKDKFIEKIFSIKNISNERKKLTILGMKIKFKRSR